jgi:actin-related protein
MNRVPIAKTRWHGLAAPFVPIPVLGHEIATDSQQPPSFVIQGISRGNIEDWSRMKQSVSIAFFWMIQCRLVQIVAFLPSIVETYWIGHAPSRRAKTEILSCF